MTEPETEAGRALDKRRTCECGHRYRDHAAGGTQCLAWVDDPDRTSLKPCYCQRWQPMSAEQPTSDGPNVRKAAAPEVFRWTVIPFGNYVWHLPTELVEQLEAQARAPLEARITALEDELRDVIAVSDRDTTVYINARALLSDATPAPTLDAETE